MNSHSEFMIQRGMTAVETSWTTENTTCIAAAAGSITGRHGDSDVVMMVV